MLNAITIIVLFQLSGEALAMLTGIPVPGSVLGMVFLLLAFFVKDDLIDLIRPTGGVLLSNLSLLFVPRGRHHPSRRALRGRRRRHRRDARSLDPHRHGRDGLDDPARLEGLGRP